MELYLLDSAHSTVFHYSNKTFWLGTRRRCANPKATECVRSHRTWVFSIDHGYRSHVSHNIGITLQILTYHHCMDTNCVRMNRIISGLSEREEKTAPLVVLAVNVHSLQKGNLLGCSALIRLTTASLNAFWYAVEVLEVNSFDTNTFSNGMANHIQHLSHFDALWCRKNIENIPIFNWYGFGSLILEYPGIWIYHIYWTRWNWRMNYDDKQHTNNK